MTITSATRHSGLQIRLFRGRCNDPAFRAVAKNLQRWIDHTVPSLTPIADDDNYEKASINLHDYDTRQIIGARNPLPCVYVFDVMVRVVLPSLYGYRTCPLCPHCAVSGNHCMDMFGSNATPTGGAAGRADAMVGAVEAQKA